jgi:HSP20 family protein
MMRFDPFRDLDRLADQLTSGMRTPRTAPMDVYRLGDHYVVHLDLPGVDPGSVDLSVEDNALTVRAHRTTRPQGEGMQVVVAERPSGEFVRQLFLGEGLDTAAHRGDVRPGRPHAAHPGRRAREAAQDRGVGRRPGVAAGHPGLDRAVGGRRRLGS